MSVLQDITGSFSRYPIWKQEKIVAARGDFWAYCQAINPKFFKNDRWHLKKIANTLQSLYEGNLLNKNGIPYRNLIINLPPGHGKSYIVCLFIQWVYGQSIQNEVISVSYNEKLSSKFAKTVRDGIDIEAHPDPNDDHIVFGDIFPAVRIKQGDASAQNWSLEGRYNSYLASSFTGTMTGMRGNIGVIDDPIKNKLEAVNDYILQKQWEWYTDTFLSRMVEGAIQILIMTRWATGDLAGRLIAKDPDKWYVLKMPAYDAETDEMLCPEIMSRETYEDKKGYTSTDIFEANYRQEPMDMKGRLYTSFATYEALPKNQKGKPLSEATIAYVDTADEGTDNLCAIVADIIDGQGYVKDVYYTSDPQEITEPETADLLVRNGVQYAVIESNNGGRGFARNVERIIWETYKTRKVSVEWFHQSDNKKARIITNSSFVQRNILFPVNWDTKWPDYHKAMSTYQREGKNKHDDAPDATTGICETIEGKRSKRLRTLPKSLFGL